jgi:hypothetical protein
MRMFSTEASALWDAYLSAEKQRVRTVALERLDAFVEKVLTEDASTRREWVYQLVAKIADKGADVPVRMPLFRRVILPVLAEGVLGSSPGCARWLAHFETLLLNTKDAGLPDNLRSAVELLKTAVSQDPADALARRRLAARVAWYFDYTLHELPAGVLYGNDGASIEECGELLALLAEFKEHLKVLEDMEKHVELIQDCELHYNGYRDYLRNRTSWSSYEHFLDERKRGS